MPWVITAHYFPDWSLLLFLPVFYFPAHLILIGVLSDPSHLKVFLSLSFDWPCYWNRSCVMTPLGMRLFISTAGVLIRTTLSKLCNFFDGYKEPTKRIHCL